MYVCVCACVLVVNMCDCPAHTHHPFHLYPLVCFNIMSLYNAAHQYAKRTGVHPKQSESTKVSTPTLKDITLALIALYSTQD